MDIYTEDDFDEYNPVTKANYAETCEEQKLTKLDLQQNNEESLDEECDEYELEEIDSETVDEVLAKSSTETRCTVLEEEIRLLKLENDLLLSREKSLKERLELFDNENDTLNNRILDYERQVSSLNKDIELIKCRSEARQSTLENNYRELCGKIATSEESNQKLRFDLNQQKARSIVLEELVETKNIAIAELERRLDHLTPSTTVNVQMNGEVNRVDEKYKDLTYKLHATERQLDQVVSELSKVVSSNSKFTNNFDGNNKSKYLDYHAMLRDYNTKCVKLKELEERLYNDENKNKVAVLEDKVKLLNEKLSSRSLALKENEKELKEFYSKQLDELKTTVSEHKMEIASKVEETNRINKNYESLKVELENKNKSLIDKLEILENIKSQNHNLNSENELLKKKLNDNLEQIRILKREKQLILDREYTHITEFKNYSKETDLKMKKMELVLRHVQTQANKQKNTHNKEDYNKENREKEERELWREREKEREDKEKEKEERDNEFKQQLLEEVNEVKQILNTLERSKKEQQQTNNLIMTLRHQNDTAINSIKEENKNTLNLFNEKSKLVLSEFKEENNNVVNNLMDKLDNMLDNVNEKNENIIKELKEIKEYYNEQVDNSVQLNMTNYDTERLVKELETPILLEMTDRLLDKREREEEDRDNEYRKYGKREYRRDEETETKEQEEKEEREQQTEQEQNTEQYKVLIDKYNKLKESFKETTTSLLKKEKVLLDSLKKTVLECHTYKTKLEELKNDQTNNDNSNTSNNTNNTNDNTNNNNNNNNTLRCKCSIMVRREENEGVNKKVKNCWCKFKNHNNLRNAISRKAKIYESKVIDSMERPRLRRRTRQSSDTDE